MGTNDFTGDVHALNGIDITAAYSGWLAAVRAACPHATIFCVTPPLGWHVDEITAAVQAQNMTGDKCVHVIDTTPLRAAFGLQGATQLAYDGVHPTIYGNALLAGLIIVQAQQILDSYPA
jgi:hypothetical protein